MAFLNVFIISECNTARQQQHNNLKFSLQLQASLSDDHDDINDVCISCRYCVVLFLTCVCLNFNFKWNHLHLQLQLCKLIIIFSSQLSLRISLCFNWHGVKLVREVIRQALIRVRIDLHHIFLKRRIILFYSICLVSDYSI